MQASSRTLALSRDVFEAPVNCATSMIARMLVELFSTIYNALNWVTDTKRHLISARSITRAMLRMQVLRGITRESVRASLSQSLRSSWSMRPGVPAFLSRASMSQFPTHVLSINWSRDLITSALLETMEALNGKSA